MPYAPTFRGSGQWNDTGKPPYTASFATRPQSHQESATRTTTTTTDSTTAATASDSPKRARTSTHVISRGGGGLYDDGAARRGKHATATTTPRAARARALAPSRRARGAAHTGGRDSGVGRVAGAMHTPANHAHRWKWGTSQLCGRAAGHQENRTLLWVCESTPHDVWHRQPVALDPRNCYWAGASHLKHNAPQSLHATRAAKRRAHGAAPTERMKHISGGPNVSRLRPSLLPASGLQTTK